MHMMNLGRTSNYELPNQVCPVIYAILCGLGMNKVGFVVFYLFLGLRLSVGFWANCPLIKKMCEKLLRFK